MVQRIGRRPTIIALIAVLMCILASMGPAWLASAEPINPQDQKDAIRQACNDSGGSFVEDANTNTYRCNLKDGGAIVCPEGGGQCWYEPAGQLRGVLGTVVVGNAGVNEGVNAGTQANPTPTPTKGKVGVGGISIVPINGGVKAPPSAGQSPTPLPGPRSGIALTLWDCPTQLPTLPRRVTGTPTPPTGCSSLDNVTNKAIFMVGGPGVQEVTIHGGGILMNGLPAGKYLIHLNPLSGYGNPVGYCGFAPSEEQGPNGWSWVPVANGSYTFELPQDQTMYCDWYITRSLTNAPAKAALATPVPAAAATPAS